MAKTFDELFNQAIGNGPFPFQREFAEADELPSLVNVPTGLGKTAMAVLGWLWRRHFAERTVQDATPRRLVYCLPMRVLVEQTRENAEQWIAALLKAGLLKSEVPVHVLMGGEDAGDWESYPERDVILVGTQDMLLSRALNRGYAASRSRWPMQFGLLHTECLWVFDEIQLMGSGLATTAQLEAFRRKLPHESAETARNGYRCHSVWMSATLRPEWLDTVDYGPILNAMPESRRLEFRMEKEIEDPAIDASAKQALTGRWNAKKHLSKATSAIDSKSQKSLAEEIVRAHGEAKGRTIVVVNTVGRACNLLAAIRNAWPAATDDNLVLVHSRFRPPERQAQHEKLKAGTSPDELPPEGMIVVSTQVIEAGVDVSATTLFTDVAPWASLVQRFGRCNRKDEVGSAQVRWIDLPAKDAEAEKVRFPYDLKDLRAAAAELKTLSDVGLESLTKHAEQLSDDKRKALFPHEQTHVIRRRDLIDLFDTTPDLAGNDIDIDRFVRDIEDTDVRVYWRDWHMNEQKSPPDEKAWRRMARDELCPAPIGDFKSFATSKSRKGKVWRWDFSEGRWEQVRDKDSIYPGQTYLAHASAGGYDPDRGWVGTGEQAAVQPLGPADEQGLIDNAYEDELPGRWQTIAQHTDDVCAEMDQIVSALPLTEDETSVLKAAARWHDWGKALPAFRAKLKPEAINGSSLAQQDRQYIGKAPRDAWRSLAELRTLVRDRDSGVRFHFRHELASALGVLLSNTPIGEGDRDLIAYLIAAHHGKVRLSIRSMPNETRPPRNNDRPRRFARGVWDGEELPGVDLGGNVVAPTVALSLEPMEIGLCEMPPFAGQPSWLERAIKLRDTLGPFRLAYLEALLRAADWRASAVAVEQEQPKPEEEAPNA